LRQAVFVAGGLWAILPLAKFASSWALQTYQVTDFEAGEPTKEKALQYSHNAPAQTMTPFRHLLLPQEAGLSAKVE
jgi:hypothetical protein